MPGTKSQCWSMELVLAAIRIVNVGYLKKRERGVFRNVFVINKTVWTKYQKTKHLKKNCQKYPRTGSDTRVKAEVPARYSTISTLTNAVAVLSFPPLLPLHPINKRSFYIRIWASMMLYVLKKHMTFHRKLKSSTRSEFSCHGNSLWVL